MDFHHFGHRVDHDHRIAVAPFVGRSPEAGAGGNRLVGDADPCACHRALGPDGFSKSGDRYQASLTWLNEPFVPHAEFVHQIRSEEHTSELQSLMRISYAVFCLKKKTHITTTKLKIINN